MPRPLDALRRFFGVKSDAQVAREILADPEVKRAREAIKLGDKVLREIEMTERRPK